MRLSSQKKLEPLLPILKRPMVAAFFIEFILLFSQAPFIVSIAISKEIGFSTMQMELYGRQA